MPLSAPQAVERVREHPGLSEQQRRFLARRVLTETDAAAAAGVCAEETAARWKANPVFLREYQRILAAKRDDLFDRVQDELARVGQLVPQTVVDLLQAETPIVDKTGQVVGMRPDWQARARAVETIQRAAGRWNPQERGQPETAGLVDVLRAMTDLTRAATTARSSDDVVEARQQQQPSQPYIIEGDAQPLP